MNSRNHARAFRDHAGLTKIRSLITHLEATTLQTIGDATHVALEMQQAHKRVSADWQKSGAVLAKLRELEENIETEVDAMVCYLKEQLDSIRDGGGDGQPRPLTLSLSAESANKPPHQEDGSS